MTNPRPSEVQALAELLASDNALIHDLAWSEWDDQAPAGWRWLDLAARLHARGVRVAPSPTDPLRGALIEFLDPRANDEKVEVSALWTLMYQHPVSAAVRGVAPSPTSLDGEKVTSKSGVAPSPDAPVDRLEQAVHPEGRCADCGGGKPYWKHDRAALADYHPFVAPSPDAPDPRTKPWLVRLTCCGRADGVYAADSWDEAQSFREAYTSGPGVSGGHVGDTGHDRSAVIEDALAASVDAPREGLALIAAERARQIAVEGYDAEHDRDEDDALSLAAAVYATPPHRRASDMVATRLWPWSSEAFKPTPGDRVRELVKAGALIAAAIDALIASESHPTKEQTDG